VADPTRGTQSLAIVGLACRFPDADDPAALLDVVLTGRRAFRRLPQSRIEIDDYYLPDLATSDATYSTRAAVIEGWRFESAAFGIDQAAYIAADPAHWLALETAARALAAAGLPAGTGLDRDRTGVIIGNTLAGDTSRANALRLRWPYVRNVLADALGTGDIPASQADTVLQRAESSYLAPFPPMGPYSLAGSIPATIASAISTYFGFRGGSHAVDSDCSSSLQAVASACAALVSGELDSAIVGGVEVSLDPLELVGLAKAGLLATRDVRIYDENPSGYLPGEGCGMVVLMRTADARAAGLPVYAEIVGWGTSGGGMPGEPQSHASSQLLAMQRAYERGGVDPADIHFIEGNGAGTPLDDHAELTALDSIRSGARRTAALGSVKANIGHAKAAAGAAGLIKTVLAMGTGVVPPSTGVDRPHELITSGDARLVLPQAARDWETGTRLAAVSTMSLGGSNVHVVLRHEPGGRGRQDRWLRSVPLLARAAAGRARIENAQPRVAAGPVATPFLLQAPDRFALAAVLSRVAEIAGGLSDAEMQDLACMLGRDTVEQGRARVAIVATRQEQLALLAREAVTILSHLADGLMAVRPGVFASDGADGQVTLLLPGDPAGAPLHQAVLNCLESLRWLEALDVNATAAVAHGLGALAGLAWAGALGESEIVEIAKLREQFVIRTGDRGSRGAEAAETVSSAPGGHAGLRYDAAGLRTAIAQRFRFGPPRRRLISAVTGSEISSVDDAIDLICNGFDGAGRYAEAIAEGAIGASLLLDTGAGRAMLTAAADVSRVPVISLESGSADRGDRARVAAALFAAGAMGLPQPLFAGRQTRPIDIWRNQTFITNPCQFVPEPRPTTEDSTAKDGPATVQAATVEAATVEAASDEAAATAAANTTAAEPAVAGQTAEEPVLELEATSAAEITDTEITETEATETEAEAETAVTEATDAEITAPVDAVTGEPGREPEPVEAEQPTSEPEPVSPGQPVEAEQPTSEPEPVEAEEPEPVAASEPEPVEADESASEPEPVTASQPEPVTQQQSAEDDLIARVRAEIERRLPSRSLIAATTRQPDAEPTIAGRPDAASEPPDEPSSVPSYWGQSTSNSAPIHRHLAPGIYTTLPTPGPGDRDQAAEEVAVPSRLATAPVDGIGPWARCFAEGLRPVRRPVHPAEVKPWRVFAAASSPVLADLGGVFTPDPTAGRTLAIVEDPADQRSRAAAVAAAKDAMTTGELIVLTTSSTFTGFFASLHAEHPSIGVTVLRVAVSVISPAAILPFAAAEPGKFRELVFGPSGAVSEPVLTDVPLPGGGTSPLGPDDVLLITRGTKGAGLALAQVFACCGTGVAVIGRADENDDGELVAGLEELRSAGARVGYEVIDIGVPASLTAAIRRIEDRLGPVTAIGHAAGLHYPVPVEEIPEPEASAYAGDEAAGLDMLTASIPAGQLRLIISIGTVASRYGLAGAGLHALSGGALASRAMQLAAVSIGCQVLHLDLPAWSRGGLGESPELAAELTAADCTALDIGVVSRLLLKIMTTPGLPRRLAVHGRVGGLTAVPAPVITAAELGAAELPGGGRFLREVAVHYPGIELVCSAGVSLTSDPYLADYQIDGMPVLPPALALEALAQAASVLAGCPVRRMAAVAVESPVLIPSGGQASLRICALRDGDKIVAALRCADSSYLVDHVSAEFSCAPDARETPEGAIAAASLGLEQLAPGPSGLVDGTELYGPICFQSGRFRRIALMPEVTARSGRALARGTDDQPWFAADGPFAATSFLLGSPALNDASLQVLQACVPHRRVRLASCESVQFSGRLAEGPVEIRAVAEPARVGPELAQIPSQPIAPPSEMAAAVRQTGAAQGTRAEVVSTLAWAADHPDAQLTAEEEADQELTEAQPQARRVRRARRHRNGGYRPSQPGNLPAASAPRPREVLQSIMAAPADDVASADPDSAAQAADAAAVSNGRDGQPDLSLRAREGMAAPSAAGHLAPAPAFGPVVAQPARWAMPQLWNVEAVDAAGQVLAAWRGVRLRDSGPLPRHAAWPPTLLSVFLERSAVDLGLDEGLRVTVSCGQPDWPLPQLLNTVPMQSVASDSKASVEGRHAGPERRALNTVKAPSVGALAGFGLMARAPVPVACGWVTVQSGQRHHEPAPGMASAFTQLRAELAEPASVLTARLNAIGACLQMAHLQADGSASDSASGGSADELRVARTTGDGWAVLVLGRAVIACAVVELSGVSAPVAVALLTRQYAHARGVRSRSATAATMS
jgi:enediyne polyketide synthase